MSIDVENLVWLTSKSNLILEIVKNEERDNAIEVVEYVLGLLRSLPSEDDEVDDEPAAGGRTTPRWTGSTQGHRRRRAGAA